MVAPTLHNPAQEASRVSPVDQAMVVGERQRHHQPGFKLTIPIDRLIPAASHAQNRHFGMVYNRGKVRAANPLNL